VKYFLISLIFLTCLFLEWNLLSRWQADKDYAIGKNYNTAQQFIAGYSYLSKAVETVPDEPTFRDELSYNQAVLANLVYDQLHNSTASALVNVSESDRMNIKIPQLGVSEAQLEQEAIKNSDSVIAASPHSVPFWKTRVKTFLVLSQINTKYFDEVVRAISTAAALAPTDAKVFYNLGLILKRAGKTPEAIQAVEKAVKLKPDYNEAIKWLDENK